MLRATSEMAVAMRASSGEGKPSSVASARPALRATTMSASEWIGMLISSSIAASPELPAQLEQSLVEVERGVDVAQRHPELHHREGHVGLDPDQHRLGPAQPQRRRDRPQGLRGERVDDVEE